MCELDIVFNFHKVISNSKIEGFRDIRRNDHWRGDHGDFENNHISRFEERGNA